MVANADIDRLIADKRRDLEEEKRFLGLSPANNDLRECKKVDNKSEIVTKSALYDNNNDTFKEAGEPKAKAKIFKDKENIPPDLERYIRRYLGLPTMLRAGEFSPNNPMVRENRPSGDVMLGLGEYERMRNTLRRHRQRQYKEYLDQQAKKKQESKEKVEKERIEKEERDRRLEQSMIEKDGKEMPLATCPLQNYGKPVETFHTNCRVDTGVQVEEFGKPHSIGVQTEENIFLPPSYGTKTTAEGELSPRRPIDPGRRTSHNCLDGRTSSHSISKGRSSTDVRPTYLPSILDAEAIHLRNLQAEKEAAERRIFYQQELKNQILEQKKIREERTAREKMLEQAEMRRLEEQLKLLKVAQEREVEKQNRLVTAMKENTSEYNIKKSFLQSDIDKQRNILFRANSQPSKSADKIISNTAYSDIGTSKLPFHYPKIPQDSYKKKPFTTNIPENSIFSPNYNVESYLRKHLNPDIDKLLYNIPPYNRSIEFDDTTKTAKRSLEDVATSERRVRDVSNNVNIDEMPITILRNSPKTKVNPASQPDLSEAMRIVEDKWKVPVVQKNIVKNLPDEDGKNISILTQLGSIRRQLQLEQLRLDNMRKKKCF